MPSKTPSLLPSQSMNLSSLPSFEPSVSMDPANSPSNYPSSFPSESPSVVSSSAPSEAPIVSLSSQPSNAPSKIPTSMPSQTPTGAPSNFPTSMPSKFTFPSGTPSIQSSIFCLNPVSFTWVEHENLASASDLNGNLVSIHSGEENWLVYHIGGPMIFIGLSEVGGLHWSDGSDVDFTAWFPGQPGDAAELYTLMVEAEAWHDYGTQSFKAVYKLPSLSLFAAQSAGYICYSSDSTGCSSSSDCKSPVS
eukprot:scaffold7233_cov63-Attheya_sp.AAC.1